MRMKSLATHLMITRDKHVLLRYMSILTKSSPVVINIKRERSGLPYRLTFAVQDHPSVFQVNGGSPFASVQVYAADGFDIQLHWRHIIHPSIWQPTETELKTWITKRLELLVPDTIAAQGKLKDHL